MSLKDAKNKVTKEIDNQKDELVTHLHNLLTYPTVMENEKDGQMYFAQILGIINAEIDIWNPAPDDMLINPNFLARRDNYENSPNVVGLIKGEGQGRSIMINGHMDVVPEGENAWDLSPWSGEVIEDRIYGRGASDMKGGLIAGYMAVKAIADAKMKLKGDIYIASVIGEETGGAGTISLISRGYKADAAIVPEPTDMYICPANLGAIWFRIKVKGIAGHAADATNGINAINVAADIIKKIDQLQEDRKIRVRHELYEHSDNPFCISVGSIKGGIFPTSIPDEVVMEGRLGYSPDENLDEVKKEFEESIKTVCCENNMPLSLSPEVEWFGFSITSGGAGKNHPIVNTVSENFRHVLNKEPVLRGTPWGTDAGALTKFGDTPAMIFGPGPGSNAHKANEYVNITDLINVAKVIACTIIDWCS